MSNSPTIEKPTLLLDRRRVEANIDNMMARAARAGVRLRPHFKTHQSAAIGDWFRQRGVEAITVSSVDMAAYFAAAGWRDITLAFPANLRQLAALDALAGQVRLNLLLESAAVAGRLSQGLQNPVDVWLKIDVGSHRTGLPWDDLEAIGAVAQAVAAAPNLNYRGILSHAGHTYTAGSPAAVRAVYAEALARLQAIRDHLQAAGLATAISVGDTPSASIVDDFGDVAEIRPGTFVFYDVMQWQLGACRLEDIAIALACPVVAVHPGRGRIVLYGGVVHLSKEQLLLPNGRGHHGLIARLDGDGWTAPIAGAAVVSLSQEHGLVEAPESLINQVEPGDLLLVLPVHACLTANLMQHYLTLAGERIDMAHLELV